VSAPPLRLGFAGTPAFAAVCLEAMVASGRRPVVVYTQPDRPTGRGQKQKPGAVKQSAETLGLAVAQPERLSGDTGLAHLVAQALDLLVVVAFGQILSRAVLAAPRLGCINVHASLLPRWRGAAPIERAILAGDSETGVCVMQVEERLDSGPVYLERRWPIGPETTGGSLHDELATLGGEALVATLELIETGAARPQVQDEDRVCYAHKLSKAEARIDWNQSAEDILRQIRAFNPRPMAHSHVGEVDLRILEARAAGDCAALPPGVAASPGAGRLLVGTATLPLELLLLQPAGKRPMPAADFLRGHGLATSSSPA
jgi:methionyl-tRNA formyltransferase